jgi:uncharacterized OB-fold protein
MATMTLEESVDMRVEERVTFCGQCGHVSLANATVCEHCGGEKVELVPPMGEIYSYTVVHRSAGEGDEVEFILALVQLSDGRLVMGQIVGPGGAVRMGQSVEVMPQTRQRMSARSGGLFFALLNDSGADRGDNGFNE